MGAETQAEVDGGRAQSGAKASGGRIASGVTYTVSARVVSTLAAVFAQVLLARWLGPRGNGLLSSSLAVLSVAMLLADLGLNSSISRLLARAYYTDPGSIPKILRVGVLLKGGLTVLVGATVLFGAGLLTSWLNATVALTPVLAMAAVQLVCDNGATLSLRALQGLHLPRLQARGQALSGVGSPVLAVVAVGALVLTGTGAPLEGGDLGRADGHDQEHACDQADISRQ